MTRPARESRSWTAGRGLGCGCLVVAIALAFLIVMIALVLPRFVVRGVPDGALGVGTPSRPVVHLVSE